MVTMAMMMATASTWLSSLSIPPEWVGCILAAEQAEPPADADALIAGALQNPIGTPPLRALAYHHQRVAILVDDCTRKTPVAQILPYVLAELAAAGVQSQQITIVVALGTHRPLTTAELHAKLGKAADGPFAIINTPATDPDTFVHVGATDSLRPDLRLPPIPAQVNRHVLEADLRIGIGMITPHLDAGYSGGAKIALPGVCSLATVDAFHLASAFVEGNQLGNPAAPLRMVLERFVAEHVPLHMIINTVLAPDGSLYACVAGDAVAAHRAGAQIAREVYGLRTPRRYPVVIANCAPYDQDLWQSIKGAWAGDLLTEDGGDLILLTAAPEGNSGYALVPHYAGMNPDLLRADILRGTVEDAMQAATGVLWGMLRRRVRLSLVSAGLGPATAQAMGADFFPSVEAATTAAMAKLPAPQRRGAAAVIPQAGVALPIPGTGNP